MSKTQFRISKSIIGELVKSYLLVIPNEKRELGMAIKVVQFADDVFSAMKADGIEAEEYIEKCARDALLKGGVSVDETETQAIGKEVPHGDEEKGGSPQVGQVREEDGG